MPVGHFHLSQTGFQGTLGSMSSANEGSFTGVCNKFPLKSFQNFGTNCFLGHDKESLFRYLRFFPSSRAEGGFTLPLVQNTCNGYMDQYYGVLDLEEWLMESSSTGKALALALGWMGKKRPLAEKGERWLIMWNWEETHFSYAICWLAFSEGRHLLLVVPLALAAHAVFWIEI